MFKKKKEKTSMSAGKKICQFVFKRATEFLNTNDIWFTNIMLLSLTEKISIGGIDSWCQVKNWSILSYNLSWLSNLS